MKYKNLMAIAIFGLLLLSQTALKAESDTVMTKNFDLGGLDGNTVRVVKFSPDGNYVYAAISGYNPIKIKTTTGDILMTYDSVKYGSQLVCSPMDLSTDGQWLVVAQSNDFIWILDTETGALVKKLKIALDSYGLYTNFYEELAISPNKKYVASVSQYGYYTGSGTASRADLTIWDVGANSIVHTQQVDLIDITPVRLKFTPDNKYLIIGHINSTDSARIEFLNVGTWDNAFTLPGHAKPITDLSISPDGSLLASSSYDGYIKIWDINNKSLYKFYNNDGHSSIVISANLFNNNFILGGGGDYYSNYPYLTIRNITTNEIIKKFIIGCNYININYINGYTVLADGFHVTIINLNNIITSVSDNIITIINNIIYPNPTNNTANIEFTLLKSEQTNIVIYDNNSNLITTLYNGLLESGLQNFQWNTSGMVSGIYYCNININNQLSTIKIIVNK